MAKLDITGLSKAFGSHPVIADFNLHIGSGSLMAILGPSGSGKTTLLRLLCGFERAQAGTIGIDGRVVSGPGVHVQPEQRRIGYVAQEGALFPHLSVADNIVFGLPRAQRRAHHRVAELLELVGLPQAYAARPPQHLSGGEQQRVALARALAAAPSVVLLDEPFSALDAALRSETRNAVVHALEATRATAVLVTHDQAEALSMGDHVAVLWQGRLAQVATPQELYRAPATRELARFVGEAVLLEGVVAEHRAVCSLGSLPLAAPTAPGPAAVMLRPEQILLLPESMPDTVPAQVESVVFMGAHANVQLALPASGERIAARISGQSVPAPGARMWVSVCGPAVAYPAATRPS
ncbi:MAG TPA: ABC transporter ATP-binding protein [Bordetella sp.]|uniref:ABC transporter ATP-binding protein n=1 Tax=Bordetella sp. TaxID=28081 RepID=UPI002ED1262D